MTTTSARPQTTGTTPRGASPPERAGAAIAAQALVKYFPVRRGWGATIRHPFRRETHRVLNGVSFEIRAGELFGLLGPNGAGKTTLLKILATLVLPDGGSAAVHAHDVAADAVAVRKLLAPVGTDERSLYLRVSASENLDLYATLHGLHGADARRRVEGVLETVGLADVGTRMVGHFSSGMKQRLLIARALLAQPRVLLLDEPTRSLDPLSARTLREFLREELVGRQGCTVLLATHNADEALGLCDRVGVLHRGRMLAIGSAAELSREYADARYRIRVVPDAHQRLMQHLAAMGITPIRTRPSSGDGDHAAAETEIEVHGGSEGAVALLRSLVEGGVPVESFERAALSLADLLERVMQARGEEEPGA